MRDINQLKERVGTAERQLATTEAARNRECEALMEMWRQIQARFANQEQEIARYRARVEALVAKNEELALLVDDMLASIESSVERSRDETVPHIAGLAKDLLATEPSESLMAEAAAALDEEPVIDDLIDIDFSDHVDDTADADQPGALMEGPQTSIDSDPPPICDTTLIDQNESLSPGIRSLISRIEQNGPSANFGDESSSDDDDGELDRELREIETLRNELSGLRERISASGG